MIDPDVVAVAVEVEVGLHVLVGEQVFVAGAHRLAEDAHLPPGIVEIILARDGVARPFQQVGDGVAEDGVAPVPDRQRPGRVGADELDVGAPALAVVGAAKGVAGG